MKKPKLVAMIPARMDSKRLKKKCVKEMDGKPMIYYAVKAAVDAHIFDEVYVNSESDLIGSIGRDLGANFYKRDPELAKDYVNNEEFVYDFLKKIKTDYLFMIHANKPLIMPSEVRRFVIKMLEDKVDTMFSVKELRTQVFYNNRPINFTTDKPHLRSYEINPTYSVEWTITGWRAKTFLASYEKKGYAVYSGKIGIFPLSEYATVGVNYEDDFILAEQMIKIRSSRKKEVLRGIIGQYHKKMSQVLGSMDLEKVQEIIKLLVEVYHKKGRIFVMGNGGSAATASHFAADISQNATRKKEGRVDAVCLNDSAPRITAIANDLGYKNIFKEQLYNVLDKNDVIVVITGSGNSPNIIEAIKFAKEVGAKSIGMLGFDGGRALDLVDIAILVKSFDYTVVENTHMFVCDLITNYFQEILNKKEGKKN